ncbi:MFS transporter [Propionibacteriaceae bacterium Y2011]|uniref:MFS transporter n=1 Tax=Microlunatus sp. Y2014 TaxID=3418488 RepID=UPI003B442CCE
MSTTPELASAPVRTQLSTTRLTVGLCIGVMAMAFESLAVSTAMPRAAEELGAKQWYAWAFSMFQGGMLFATVTAGRIADRLGPVRPMLVGMAVFAVGLVISGLAPTMVQLIIGRAVQGLGAGAMGVSLYVIIAKLYPDRKRPAVMSWISTAWVLPGFVGPPVSGWLTEHLSWHWVFGAVLPVVGVAAVLLTPTLLKAQRLGLGGPDDDPDGTGGTGGTGGAGSRPVPIWAAGMVAAAVPLLQYAAQQPGWWSLLMIGVAGLLLWRGLPRLMPAGLWRMRRGLGPVVALRFVVGGVYMATEAFLVLMLVDQYHLDLRIAGLVLTIGTVGWTIGSFTQARWRIRRDLLMTIGVSGVTLGAALSAVFAWQGTAPFWVFGTFFAISALGMGMAYTSTSLAVMTLSGPNDQGRNAASLSVAEALGASLLTGLAGAGYAYGLRMLPDELPVVFGAVFVGVTLVAALGVLASRRIGRIEH